MQAATRRFSSTANKILFYVVGGTFAAFPVFVLIYAEAKGEMQLGGFVAGSFITLAFLGLCAMFFIDSSELVLDDTAIRREVFGHTCMPIAWQGIKVIRQQFLVNQRYGGKIRIDILPTTISDIALRVRQTIKISEQVENFDELVGILNQKIEQYAIPVELYCNGLWKQESSLSASVTG